MENKEMRRARQDRIILLFPKEKERSLRSVNFFIKKMLSGRLLSVMRFFHFEK